MSKTWSEAEIKLYIDNQVEESLTLDYKAAGSFSRSDEKKKVEITKDVSAMANSAGGILIYGLREYSEPSKKHLAERLDAIDRTQFPKEWLEQIINNIRPHISGVVICPVSLSSGANDVAYVVEIPQSNTAHQATDFRYYRRFNFQSVPMQDYEVRDVMNRATTPDASVEFRYRIREVTSRIHQYRLEIFVKNLGSQVINHFQLEFTFPRVIECSHLPFKGIDNIDQRSTSRGDYLIIYRSKMVLFPNEERDIGLEMVWDYEVNTESYGKLRELEWRGAPASVGWTLYADNMTPKRGTIPFEQFHSF